MVGAIRCLVGDVGSGKSLRCVVEAILAAQAGREVYMNFPLKLQFAVDYPELAARVHYVEDFYGFLEQREIESRRGRLFREFEALFVIDEAQNIWNSRSSMDTLQKMSTNYIFISRKIGLELFLATQLAGNIDKRAKGMVQLWAVCTKFCMAHGVSGCSWCKLSEDEFYFQFEYYQPETGKIAPRFLAPEVAAQYYPYYETTGPTSIGPLAPLLGGGEDAGSRPVSMKKFNFVTTKQSEALKELVKEIRGLNKKVAKIEKRKQATDEAVIRKYIQKHLGTGKSTAKRRMKNVKKHGR